MGLATAIIAALAAAAPATPSLPATGPWVVDAGENMCVLMHAYGAGDRKITVAFQPMFALKSMEIMVLTPSNGAGQRVGDARLVFGPGGERIEGRYFSVEVPDKKTRFTRLTVPRTAFDQLKTASTLSIRAFPVDLDVEIKRPDKALAAFDTCQKDLLVSWGVDPALMAEGRTPKPHDIWRLFSPSQYPREALHSGIYGRVVTVLQVTPAGTVSNCRVVASAGKVLNEGTCAVAMRARFDPARAADGTAIPSIYVLPVRWLVPGAER